MAVSVREISSLNGPEFKRFLDLPRRVYDNDSPWIAPLNREIRRKLDPATNSFFSYGQARSFVAYDGDGKACGRVAAIINPWHEKIHKERMGFFGLFESINDPDVARALFRSVFEVLTQSGCDQILGPVNLTTNDESGFLIEGYDAPPTFMCNYCPPYYHDLMQECGFTRAIDTLSYEARYDHPFPEKYYRLIEKIEANPRISVRRFNKKTARQDIMAIAAIYNESLRETWGFVPMSESEALELSRGLIPIADFDLVWIASFDGKPAGAILGFPDINEILGKIKGKLFPFGFLRFIFGRRKIRGMRVAALGVLPDYRRLGIETILINRVHERGFTRPYFRCEFSVVMENNLPMCNLLERFGFKACRRYRLYTRTISEKI